MTRSGQGFGNLIKNSSMMFLLNVAGAGVSVITIPIMLGIAGVQTYGHLVLIQSLALTAYTVCSFQYWQGMLVVLPGHRLGAGALRGWVRTSLRYELLGMSVVVFGVLGLSVAKLPQVQEFGTLDLLLLALSAIFPVIGTHTAYFRLVNRYNVLMFAGFVASVLKLVCLYAVSRYAPSLLHMVLAFTLPEFVRCLLLFVIVFSADYGTEGALDPAKINARRVRDAGRWSTLQAIGDLPVVHLDRVIIGFAMPGQYLGVFAILKRIYALINMATSPFYSTSIPEFASRANSGDVPGAFALWRRTMKMLFVVTSGAAALCFATQGIWMPRVFPVLEPYRLEFLIVLVSAVIAGTFVTTHALYWALGNLRQTTVISVVTNLIYLGLLALMTFYGGLAGAVGAFLVHVLLVATVKTLLLQRIAREQT